MKQIQQQSEILHDPCSGGTFQSKKASLARFYLNNGPQLVSLASIPNYYSKTAHFTHRLRKPCNAMSGATIQSKYLIYGIIHSTYYLRWTRYFSCRIAEHSMVLKDGPLSPAIKHPAKQRQDSLEQGCNDRPVRLSTNHLGARIMGKEQKSVKAEKKKPVMTPKEKKAAKKSKKESKDTFAL
ncbi:MAG: hypothetical protein Q7V00_06485 [Sulfurimicrobium sp.]|nr:hypothetical protein [Sulfurimicrobium sp.]MDP1705180.1 hypothetical protein [Sulfurimicrobium sp.]MDP2199622.1 hypothetical protein [Sulfurimicrobium sp.]MDP3687582.1 hypothetical protein [Sulfurimicrobium sp.]